MEKDDKYLFKDNFENKYTISLQANKQTNNIYILYDEKTLKIIKCFDGFCQAEDFAKDNNLKIINRTNPKNKDILNKLLNIE